MTESNVDSVLDELGQKIDQFSGAVAAQSAATEGVTETVTELKSQNKELRKQAAWNHKLLIWVCAGVILAVVASLLGGSAAYYSYRAVNEVRSCTTPEGKCARRQNAATGPALGALAAQSELNRIDTELPAAIEKNDEVYVRKLQEAIPRNQKKIADAEQLRRDIQSGKVPLPPVPTTVQQ